MLGRTRPDEGVVDRSTRDARACKLGEESRCRLVTEEPRMREALREQPRNGRGGPARRCRQSSQDRERLERRVAGEPEPSVAECGERRLVLLMVGDVSATATLVSTRNSGLLALADIAERANEVVVDLDSGSRDDEPAVTCLEGLVAGQRLHTQAGGGRSHLHLPRSKPELVAKLLRNHQTPCLVNGCANGSSIPS